MMFNTKDILIVDFFLIAGKVVDVPDEVHISAQIKNIFSKNALTMQVGRDSSLYTPYL